jgi:hypothetical protein
MPDDGAETCAEFAGIEPPAGRDTCDDEAFADTDDLEATCAVGSAVIVIALSGLSKCS